MRAHPLRDRQPTRGPWLAARSTTLVIAIAILVTSPVAAVAEPHGGYTSATLKCPQCHGVHTSASSKLLVAPDEKRLCYLCHDGTGSIYDVQREFGESAPGTSTKSSSHPVPGGALACHDCHTPHRGPAEGNPMSLAAGGSKVATTSAVCGGCHGAGTALPGGDHLTPIEGTPHEESVTPPPSGSDVRCIVCHEPHGSENALLVRQQVRDPWGTTRTIDTSSGQNPLCLSCHGTGKRSFPGEAAYATVRHSSVAVSSVAATSYPSSGGRAGECKNCHEPHGRATSASYTRAEGNQLCLGCHDAAGVSYPAGYSYRGGTVYGSGAHQSVSTTMGYADLFADSAGFAAWESTFTPSPSSPGQAITGVRLEAMRYVDATMAVTALATATGDFDYQTYRFRLPAAGAQVRSIRLNWTGFGEDVAGYPTTVSVWDSGLGGGSGGWSTLRSGVLGDTTTVSADVTVSPSTVSAAGYLYAMVSVRHATKATILSGPMVSEATSTTAKIIWTTLGRSTSWVDIGADPWYGGTFGSAEMTTTHSVIVPLSGAGVYHVRVRSADAEGTEATSADQAFGAPAPVTNPVGPDLPNVTTIAFSWNAVQEALRAPYTYQLSVRASDGVVTSYPWQSETTRTVVLPYDTWTWWVTGRDKDGQLTAQSASRVFCNYYYDPSCPILYTWDGAGWRFITDVMGFGTLGVKQGSGYRWPPPVEESRIDPGALVEQDGRYRIKLTNEKAEIDFIDEVRLRAVDHPQGTNVYLNDYTRSGTATWTPEWRIYTTRNERPPVAATYTDVPLYTGPAEAGTDIADELARTDGVYAPSRLFDDNQYVFDLGDLSAAPEVKLVVTGWTQYATPEERSAWEKSGAPSAQRVLEVQDADGAWVVVDPRLPFIPGYTKSVVYDLTGKFPAGVTRYKVRMRGFYRTWLDSVKVDTSRTESVTVSEIAPDDASLGFKGVSRYTADPAPRYDYDEVISRRPPQQTGMFTKYGPVLPLLRRPDDMFVVMDSGDELSVSFPALAARPDSERTFLIHMDGYFQELSGKVDPMPFHAMSNYPYRAPEHYPDDEGHIAYLAEWNTRSHPTAAQAPQAAPSVLSRVWSALVKWLVPDAPAAAPQPDVPRSVHTDSVSLQVTYERTPTVGGASCGVCHAVHGQPQANGAPFPALLAENEAKTCTGAGTGSCHSSAANSADGVNVLARVSSVTANARHDLTAEAQAASGSRITCSDCHDPHKETTRQRFSNPDSLSETVTAPANDYVSATGEVFLLAGAEHDGVAPLISNVRVDNTTPTVPALLWGTDEPATGWLDLGETTSYELGSLGATLPLSVSHRVQSLELTPGVVYHYRLRSSDALGNERFTGDATMTVAYPPPASVLSTVPSVVSYLPVSVTATWTAVSAPDGDAVEYFAEMWDVTGYGGPYLRYTSGWRSSTAWTLNVSFSGNLMVRVRARDAGHTQAVGAWSNEQVFNITVPSGTCPYLFTFDGTGMAFECDLYGTGKLGMKSKGDYLMPQPDDYLVLGHAPAPVDGAYDLRLVEERLEVDYLDELKLYAVDAVAGRDVVTEMPTLGEAPLPGLPGILHTVAPGIRGAPSAVHVDSGTDVTAKLDRTDGDYVLLNEDRNVGFDYQTVELDLSGTAGAAQTKLVIEGRTMFPNDPAGTARSSTFSKRTRLEVQDVDGAWRSVPATELVLPKPMEFEKPYAVDLTRVLEGTTRKVRLSFLFKTYLDSIKVDTTLDEPVRLTEVPMLSAELRPHGFDPVSDRNSELYEYVYGKATGDSQYFTGNYTRFGDVTPLLADADDEFVIYGGGDEIALRFALALPPAPGLERSWMVSSRGYYKDVKTDLAKTVEPLPFAGMSSYPYAAGESYPSDAEHKAYLAEWNTRAEPERRDPQNTIALSLPAGGTRAVTPPSASYSLDTDSVRLSSIGLGRAPFVYAASAGWESFSASITPPTPSAPGGAVGSDVLDRVASTDGSYWRTDLTGTGDRLWNWQVVRFTIPSADLARISELRASWAGHGEPSASYRTSISIWNDRTRSWEATFTKTGAGSDTAMTRAASAVPKSVCLSCHDGSPPPGVTVPAGIANIGSGWGTSFHGATRASGGSGGGLISDYVRDQAPDIQCATCHDPHGSSNVWHIPATVKDKTGVAVGNGSQFPNLCSACHTGGIDEWHYGACSCHYNWDPADDAHSPGSFTGRDCASCHGHNKTFNHISCHGSCHFSWSTL